LFVETAVQSRKRIPLIWVEKRQHEQTRQAMLLVLSEELGGRYRLRSFLDVHTARK